MSKVGKAFRMNLIYEDKSLWTLNKMLELKAETHCDKPFIQYEEESPLSFREVNERVNKVAHGLAKLGVKRGDKVSIFLPNCLEYIYTWFAVSKLGAVEVPVNSAYKGYFLEHVANNSRAEVMVVDQELLDRVKASEEKFEHLKKLIVWRRGGVDEDKIIPFEKFEVSLYESLYDNPSHNPNVEVSYKDDQSIIYTSGTTGPSKGALLAHAWMHTQGEKMISMLHITDNDIYLLYLPLFHGNAQCMITMSCLIAGAKVVIYERFSASAWLDQVRKSGATLTNLVGVMMDFVFRQPERPDDGDNNLRAINAYPCPATIYAPFKKRFKVDQLLEIYGMTEIGFATMMPFGDYRAGSCGKVVEDFVEVLIADPETDEELPPNQVGEMLVRPKIPWTLNSGYYGMPDKTAEAYRNAWFHTGDALKVDEDGYYYFVDRIKDALRKGGENVSSFEVEKVINDHPAVAESAVVAVKSEYHGGEDEVKACVVLKPGHTLTPEELLNWCDDRMPHFSIPRYIEFMEAFPKTPTEKVMKGKLREQCVTPTTWDRLAAGYKLKEEIKKAQKRGAKSR